VSEEDGFVSPGEMLSLAWAVETTVPPVLLAVGGWGSCIIWLGATKRAGSTGASRLVASFTCMPFRFSPVALSADPAGASYDACRAPDLFSPVAAAVDCHEPDANWVLPLGLTAAEGAPNVRLLWDAGTFTVGGVAGL
jgi:hypothetical protein